MDSEFQICGAEILKPRDPNDKLCRDISDENRISAKTLRVDNTERGQ